MWKLLCDLTVWQLVGRGSPTERAQQKRQKRQAFRGSMLSTQVLEGKSCIPYAKTVPKFRVGDNEKQLNLYLSVQRVFTAAEGPRARDLCARSLAWLEALAVLHQREQRHWCAQSSWLTHPHTLRECGTILQERERYLARILCLNLGPNKPRGKLDLVPGAGTRLLSQ